MYQQESFFLGVITDPAWQRRPNSALLISLGPGARAALAAAWGQVQLTGKGLSFTEDELIDFGVQQLKVDGMNRLSSGIGLASLATAARNSPSPIPLPGNQMRRILQLLDEENDLRSTRQALTPAGLFVMNVNLDSIHPGESFAIRGGIALSGLA